MLKPERLGSSALPEPDPLACEVPVIPQLLVMLGMRRVIRYDIGGRIDGGSSSAPSQGNAKGTKARLHTCTIKQRQKNDVVVDVYFRVSLTDSLCRQQTSQQLYEANILRGKSILIPLAPEIQPTAMCK